MVEKDRRFREVKEIKFNFIDGLHALKEVEQFVNKNLELLSPYLEKIIRAFYDLNCPEGKELDENLPEVQFTIPFRTTMPIPTHERAGRIVSRVFKFQMNTNSQDSFTLCVWEFVNLEKDVQIAEVELKFSDWLM